MATGNQPERKAVAELQKRKQNSIESENFEVSLLSFNPQQQTSYLSQFLHQCILRALIRVCIFATVKVLKICVEITVFRNRFGFHIQCEKKNRYEITMVLIANQMENNTTASSNVLLFNSCSKNLQIYI